MRGFIEAFDQSYRPGRCGKRTPIPGPGEPGNDSWKGDAWKTGAGSTWKVGPTI